jgi:hypothetical protein
MKCRPPPERWRAAVELYARPALRRTGFAAEKRPLGRNELTGRSYSSRQPRPEHLLMRSKTSKFAISRPEVDVAAMNEPHAVDTDELNENSDGDFEPRTELNQPAGGLSVLIAA